MPDGAVEHCPQCDAVVDTTGVAPGGPLRCDRCGTRFPRARRVGGADGRWSARGDADGLGIHPALAKKYRERNSLAPQGASGEGAPEVRGGDVDAPGALPAPVPPPRVQPPPVPKETRVLGDADPVTTNPGRPVARRSGEGPAPKAAAPQPPRPPPPAPVAEPAPLIPGYAVGELIGKGAMGRVYKAVKEATRRAAAIKILATELAARPDFIARFEREGAAMRAVQHPGVVTVLDAGAARQPDGSTAHFIAMEFVDGLPMRSYLEKGALAPEAALRFARLIIQGLGAAHARGVIHRDLKPENILVVPGTSSDHERVPPIDRLVLVDFGLAGILDEENDPHPNLTKSRMTMGTVNYMAPEQRTDAKRVDQRADLYAAGVIFYELLTGDLPLGRFALPTERGVSGPPSIDKVIVRALARNPNERYQQAAEFDADLRAIEAELLRTGQATVVGRAERRLDRAGPKKEPFSSQRAALAPVGGVLSGADALAVPASDATAWLAALPWLRRSSVLWAVGALAAGALLALALRGIGVLPG
ncbi:MAG: serine/threonine protein kinase [Deltaproteobacteria bacterium]|nr:serine/threonine protein kinase [Deltaproteobacteria bacterium]